MKIDLIIPSSFTSNYTSLIQRTLSIANIARAAAIFGVDNIYVYPDPLEGDPNIKRQIIKILKYMNTAPYLRKMLFRIDRDLDYVGLLPPLRTPLHKEKMPIKHLNFPEYREGIVVKSFRNKSIIDVGLDKMMEVNERLPIGKHVIVMIMKDSANYLHGELVDRYEVPVYTGFKVINIKSKLPSFLEKYAGEIVFTSRKGSPINEVVERLKGILKGRIGLIFGGPTYGIFEILEYYGLSPYEYTDLVINLVPNQRVATIRVEEAIFIALSIINYLNIVS